MADLNGFTDLRIGHGAQGVGDDSVWPTFTDIMTVIVMIFLMALVVIMVRNSELDQQLLATMSDREAAKALNQDLFEAKSLLESSLEHTQSERDKLKENLSAELEKISMLTDDQHKLENQLSNLVTLRHQLESANSQLNSEKDQAHSEIEKLVENEQSLYSRITELSNQLSSLELISTEEISALTIDKRTLGEKLDTVSIQLLEVKMLLDQTRIENLDLSKEIVGLKQENEGTEELYSIAAEQIRKLINLIKMREIENAALQVEADTSAVQYRSLQEEYDSLDEKYRELIRPARSAAGKIVVGVWLEKGNAGFLYRIKKPDQGGPVYVDRETLELELGALKEQHGQSLYIRIIIPEKSELSHNDAWKITDDILQKFDYYYQQP
jgi:chromosome segregation ATPase